MIGLMLCLIGDAFLVFEDYFLIGLVAFVFGHCAYIASFGFGSKLHVGMGLGEVGWNLEWGWAWWSGV